MTEPVIMLRDAACEFDEGRAGVHDIALEVGAGTLLGVIGPSGSGKTTTVRLITGTLRPTRGEVRVLGQEPARFRRSTRERIGYMPQQFMLYPDLTASENVDFVASLFGLLLRRRRRRVRAVLELVDLWAARGRRAGTLSGGEQRRLELACALVHEPELLLLDEPTAGIDPLLRERIWTEIGRLRDAGRTLLVTTQYVAEAEHCDRVALIADGRLIAIGTPEALRREATGGDVIEVEATGAFDPEILAGHPGVRAVESTGLRNYRVIADDAGTLLAALDDLVTRAGGRLTAARESHLTFDEIFARLVRKARAEPIDEPGATATPPSDGRAA